MKALVDDLLFYSSKSLRWIEENKEIILREEKSAIEYYEMTLFNHRQDLTESLLFLKSHYNPMDSEKYGSIYFKAIEKEAIDFLMHPTDSRLATITFLTQKGFLAQLLEGNISLEILANRDYLYIITHDIFYSSIFCHQLQGLDYVLKDSSKIVRIFEYGLLLSIRHHDIDVLLELLVCLCVLRLESIIKPSILELVLVFVKIFCNEQGFIGVVSQSENLIEAVYHPSLVGGILYYVLEGR